VIEYGCRTPNGQPSRLKTVKWFPELATSAEPEEISNEEGSVQVPGPELVDEAEEYEHPNTANVLQSGVRDSGIVPPSQLTTGPREDDPITWSIVAKSIVPTSPAASFPVENGVIAQKKKPVKQKAVSADDGLLREEDEDFTPILPKTAASWPQEKPQSIVNRVWKGVSNVAKFFIDPEPFTNNPFTDLESLERLYEAGMLTGEKSERHQGARSVDIVESAIKSLVEAGVERRQSIDEDNGSKMCTGGQSD
jgi:hypothetical protein